MTERALHIAGRLAENGYAAFLAGGCVRDMVMNRVPEDVDIATDARPEDVAKLFSKTVPVGVSFGVMKVILDKQDFEVATFRTEGPYLDGRRPSEVDYASPEKDAHRRDFTVNGMFYDPAKDEIIDFGDGRADIEKAGVRTIGDAVDRFEEDKLRLLRAVRFAAKLEFEIDPGTWEAMCKLATKVTQTSWERIRDEIIKVLLDKNRRRGFELMRDSGLLREVLPEVADMIGVEQPSGFHPEGDVFTHTMLMIEKMDAPTETLALGVLLHDVGKPPTFAVRERIRFDNHCKIGAEMAGEICKRLRCSRKTIQRVQHLVAEHMRFKDVLRMRDSTLKRFLRSDNFDELLDLYRLDCVASHGELEAWEFCKRKLEELGAEQIRPEPLLRGKDLIGMGYAPGPLFSEILTAVEDAQLDGAISTREEAQQLVNERFPLH
jgi:poly(A) polymerase